MRRVVLRSTTTERSVPPRLVNASVAAGLRGTGNFMIAARTSSTGASISPAANSICSWTSSVSPRAAKIASSRVGGSWRTRRDPYLVFQVVLIAKAFALFSIPASHYHRFAATQQDQWCNAQVVTQVIEITSFTERRVARDNHFGPPRGGGPLSGPPCRAA